MGLATETAKRPWSQEDIEQIQLLMDEDLDPVDIALRLDRSVSAVKSKMQSIRQALRLRQDAERARIDDEAKQARGSLMVYRLLEPLTEDEAFALGLCLPEAEVRARQFGISEPFGAGWRRSSGRWGRDETRLKNRGALRPAGAGRLRGFRVRPRDPVGLLARPG